MRKNGNYELFIHRLDVADTLERLFSIWIAIDWRFSGAGVNCFPFFIKFIHYKYLLNINFLSRVRPQRVIALRNTLIYIHVVNYAPDMIKAELAADVSLSIKNKMKKDKWAKKNACIQAIWLRLKGKSNNSSISIKHYNYNHSIVFGSFIKYVIAFKHIRVYTPF